jgi:predicted transcriptional regulator
MKENPLQAWFERTGEAKLEFADENDISRNTLFDILGDKRKDFRIGTLSKIESGTGGQVTARMIMEWLSSIRVRRFR